MSIVWTLGLSQDESCVVRTAVIERGFKIDSFHVEICNKTHHWEGEYSNTEMEAFGVSTNRGKEYIPLTKEVLCGEQCKDFEFEFDPPLGDGLDTKLIWKQLSRDSLNAKFKMGEISLRVQPKEALGEAIYDVLTECVNEIGRLKAEQRSGLDSKLKLSLEKAEALETVKTAVKAKDAVEAEFIDGFLRILNSKKKLIADLKSNQNNIPTTSGPTNNEEEGNENTDEEKDKEEEIRRENSLNLQSSFAKESLPAPIVVPKRQKRGAKRSHGKDSDSEQSLNATPPLKRTRSQKRESGSGDSSSLLSKIS